jgi:crotonobetainyl-CoA:carnitine CoA-transferase CaiB-like acyl-CoA transferase
MSFRKLEAAMTGSHPPLTPLAGVKVLDLSRYIPGNLLTLRLADLGADVVKVESPAGDALRRTPPFAEGTSLYHTLLDRGKQSIVLDLKTDGGRAALQDLAHVADVVVEVSRGDGSHEAIERSALRAARPEVIVVTVSGFGQTGPFAGLPAHGLNVEALAGTLPVEWDGARPRLGDIRFSGGSALELAALNGALSVVAALFHARATGVGASLDVSCWDALIESRRLSIASAYARDGASDTVTGLPLGPLYALYATADRRVVQFCAIERHHWDNFCRAAARPDLTEKWTSESDYWFGDDAMTPVLESLFAERTEAEWFDLFMKAQIPASPVLSASDLVEHPHLVARRLVHGHRGRIPVIASAVRWSEADARPGETTRPAPQLGGDQAAVLARWLGV